MISVISRFGNKDIDDELDISPIVRISKTIMIQKINPKDYKNEEQDIMGKFEDDEDIDLSPEELEALEKEIPPEVDEVSEEDLDNVPAEELDQDDDDFADDLRAADSINAEDLDDEDGVKVTVDELDRDDDDEE